VPLGAEAMRRELSGLPGLVRDPSPPTKAWLGAVRKKPTTAIDPSGPASTSRPEATGLARRAVSRSTAPPAHRRAEARRV